MLQYYIHSRAHGNLESLKSLKLMHARTHTLYILYVCLHLRVDVPEELPGLPCRGPHTGSLNATAVVT
jgi:hypothetical protein